MNRLFLALGLDATNRKNLLGFSKKTDIDITLLEYYNRNNILPSETDLQKIKDAVGVSALTIQLAMGITDESIIDFLKNNFKEIETKIHRAKPEVAKPEIFFSTSQGQLYSGDCLSLLTNTLNDSFDVIFADPPFNLNKFYLSQMDDNLHQHDYLSWCEKWLSECVRTLKPGGSLFLWNLPKWNTQLSSFLNSRLTFRHWIATDIKFSLPIQGKLYPSHYSLLYYCKGEKPKTFKPDRLPMEICKNCYKEIKDYGGYKNKMNPKGVNLSDVWTDIPPVRHKKYKKRVEANELSIKLLDRIIEMSSEPNDVIFDPFGGSGTTYVVAEIKNRNWVGIELGPLDDIVNRFANIEADVTLLNQYRDSTNHLFSDENKRKRKQRGLWTDDTFVNLNEAMEFDFSFAGEQKK
jgi:site-specific DNA-methyltransferase (adenine-specific)